MKWYFHLHLKNEEIKAGRFNNLLQGQRLECVRTRTQTQTFLAPKSEVLNHSIASQHQVFRELNC